MMNDKSTPNLFVLMMARFLMEAAWMAGCPITWNQAMEYVVGGYEHIAPNRMDRKGSADWRLQ